jgi:hypothetical protein
MSPMAANTSINPVGQRPRALATFFKVLGASKPMML